MVLLADWMNVGSPHLIFCAVVVRCHLILQFPEGSTGLDPHGSSLTQLVAGCFLAVQQSAGIWAV